MDRAAHNSVERLYEPSTAIYLLKRLCVLSLALLIVLSLTFVYVHFGPNPPGEATTTASQAALEQKKRAFGLYRPLWVQYLDYLHDMLTFEFGQSWSSRHINQAFRVDPITDVNALVAKRFARTAWLWLWALLLAVGIGLPVGLGLGLRGTTRDRTTASVSGALVRAVPVFLVSILLLHWVLRLQIVFGFNWYTFGVDIPSLSGPIQIRHLTNPHGFLVAVKRVLPPALALASALVGPMVRVGQRAMQETMDAGVVEGARVRGVPTSLLVGKHVLRNAMVPFVLTLRATAAILIGGAVIVEDLFVLEGLGTLFWEAVRYGDYTSFQATMFVFVLLLAGATLLQDVLYVRLTGSRLDRTQRASAVWTAPTSNSDADVPHRTDSEPRTLRSLRHNATANFRTRLRANPRPALLWALGGLVLFAVEAGAVVNLIDALPGLPTIPVEIPTLLSREVIPNMGHRTAGGGWTGTFLGLEPAHAWLLRVAAVYLYAVAWIAWGWVGYRLYRSRYREADTTTTDAIFGRLRRHRWGQFGFVVVFVFVVMAVFAPTLGPTTFDRVRAPTTLHHLNPPFLQGTVTYFDAETGEVTTTSLGSVILSAEAGRWSYDAYGRFHPLGTVNGTDLFTELLFGARVYLLVGVIAMVVAITIALVFGVLSGYYRGRIDGGISVLSDIIGLLPVLPIILMLTVAFSGTWIIDPAVQIVFTAVVFALLVWPALWRTIRAVGFRAGESDWLDATRGFGQSSRMLMSRRLAPHLGGYLLVYGLHVQAGVIIVTAVLEYWAGIPTIPMGWGVFIDPSLSSPAPTVALMVVVTGFTALADGLRDALDPDCETGTSAPGETIGTGGGG